MCPDRITAIIGRHQSSDCNHSLSSRPFRTLQGVFNADSFWSDEAPPLPAVAKPRVKSTGAKKEFQKPVGGSLTSTLAASTSLGGTAPMYEGVAVPPPAAAMVLTTLGLKAAAQSAEERLINQSLGGGTEAGGVPRSTFQGVVKSVYI